MGYARPTPVQKHAVPFALGGRDVMCCAQTGSGKTCAFLLPVVAHLGNAGGGASTVLPYFARGGADQVAAAPRCVVLAPTRELAIQIDLEAKKLCNRSGLSPVVVYGGAKARPQLLELARGVDICVATPGRLIDFIDRGVCTMAYVEYLVLDEADRMLDMGFEPQIRRIVQQRDMPPPQRRKGTLMFSATFPPEIQKLAGEFMRDYVWIAVGRVGSTVDSIEQRLFLARGGGGRKDDTKLRLLAEALDAVPGRTLVFCKMKREAHWLSRALQRGQARTLAHERHYSFSSSHFWQAFLVSFC